MTDTTLGQTIKAARVKLNYGLRPLAQKLGLSPGYICQVEYNKCPPPKEETLVRIAKALEIDPDILLRKAGKIPSDIIDGLLRIPGSFVCAREFIAANEPSNNKPNIAKGE